MSGQWSGSVTTPPCAQKCWEYIDRVSWVYVDSIDACGHAFDPSAGIWRWKSHPIPNQETA